MNQQQPKTIKLNNSNNRLAANHFIHIGKAPATPINGDQFPIHVIVESDSGWRFHAKLISIVRTKLEQLGSVTTIVASGLSAPDFKAQFRAANPGVEDVAVYVYAHAPSPYNIL